MLNRSLITDPAWGRGMEGAGRRFECAYLFFICSISGEGGNVACL